MFMCAVRVFAGSFVVVVGCVDGRGASRHTTGGIQGRSCGRLRNGTASHEPSDDYHANDEGDRRLWHRQWVSGHEGEKRSMRQVIGHSSKTAGT